MKLGWRSYCPICNAHVKKHDWSKVLDASIEGHHYGKCPECGQLLEKYNTLDECGFGRTVKVVR